MFPLVGELRTRGHNFKTREMPLRTEMRRNFFTQWALNLWNSLSQRAVAAQSLSVFNVETDRFLMNNNVKGYGDSVGKRH